MSSAEQANADFYYNLGDEQLETVGEDDLDAHTDAPIFADLRSESEQYLREDEVPNLVPSVWDRFEDNLTAWRPWMAWAWSLVLGAVLGVIGFFAVVTS
ncbi:hypothetical protein [Rhodococcus jostii]|uniref:hypothetical protein n=1 Tax=Rhodococcus jostii TaxID=132919 RepID=UPI00363F2CA2